MTKLKEANFSSNRLTALPSSLGSCSSLKLINCSDNQLSSLPSSLGALDALEDLQCANNSIASIPSSFDGDAPTLNRKAQNSGRES
jgi:adenylate cyclase